jgi:hypothetical protein
MTVFSRYPPACNRRAVMALRKQASLFDVMKDRTFERDRNDLITY